MNRKRQKLDPYGVKHIVRVKSIPHKSPEIVAEIDGEEVRLELDLKNLEPQHHTALSRDSAAMAHVIVAVLTQACNLEFEEFSTSGLTTYWVRMR